MPIRAEACFCSGKVSESNVLVRRQSAVAKPLLGTTLQPEAECEYCTL